MGFFPWPTRFMNGRPFPASRHNSLHAPQPGQSKVLAQAGARKELGRIARSRPKHEIARPTARPNSFDPEKSEGHPRGCPSKTKKTGANGATPARFGRPSDGSPCAFSLRSLKPSDCAVRSETRQLPGNFVAQPSGNLCICSKTCA